MELGYLWVKRPHLSPGISCRIYLTVVALAGFAPAPAQAQTYGPNLLPAGNFENVQSTYVPWAGVDDKGNIHGIEGKELAVGDDGGIRLSNFGPGIAVGDLTGSGKQDLVLADSYGFFWYFPNSGTPQKPVFTQGEIIPVWLGENSAVDHHEGFENVVPRIQLVDFTGSKLLDIVAGTYTGKLFRIPNSGSAAQPDFQPTVKPDLLLINTRKNGVLWSNYLAPFMTNQFGSQDLLDLIMGEGTYSANSIYLLRNTGSNANPSFDEDHTQKIIPGMGLEQLTPAVVDWNNDGKPDIICGDRTGNLNLYLNNSADPDNPTFAAGTRVKLAGVAKLGGSIAVAIGDLSGNHLPNLLIGRDDGTVLYAQNTGKLGEPSFFLPATPLKGILPPDYHYIAPRDWWKGGVQGAPYELLACVNPKIEPGFTFPEGENSKYALKFFVWPVKNNNFQRYYPPVENQWNDHIIGCGEKYPLDLKLNKTYRVHFWVKADRNVSGFYYKFFAWRGQNLTGGIQPRDVITPVDVGTSWTESTTEFKIENPDDPTTTNWGYRFEFHFPGQPTVYLDDVSIQEESE